MNRRPCRDESGQSLVIAVVFLTVLLGFTATVIDVGSWFRAQRAAQAAADAAALAGAQALPGDPAGAVNLALDYAAKNGGGLAPADVSIQNGEAADDTISVTVKRSTPAFFASLFGIHVAEVSASAGARAFLPGAAKWVAPIVVRIDHPDLTGAACGQKTICTGDTNSTTLTLADTGAPGAFDMLNLDPNQQNGTIGTSTLANWIQNGFDQYLPIGGYYSDPGTKFNSSQIQAALTDRMQTNLLFPVYDNLQYQGSNAEYHIAGWASFHLTGFSMNGSGGTISGWFDAPTIWDGIETSSGGTGQPNFGVTSVELVK